MTRHGDVYEFVFRGVLAEESLDSVGRRHRRQSVALDQEYQRTLGIDILDEEIVAAARSMATVYTAIAAFEISVRRLITTVLLEQVGADWWTTSVSEKIRAKADGRRLEEERVKWHSQRGADPIEYTQMGDLVAIIRQNWPCFEPHLPSIEWVASIVDVLERSRNVIMHSGQLERPDVERIGVFIRDWVKQVGG
ncbi:MAG: Swt1 family HEPN domain-containing protein [Gemmatimonadales bacterium]|nr:Swt1 family HEPN domain-containing protein [Gemmatimonadales bacterium]